MAAGSPQREGVACFAAPWRVDHRRDHHKIARWLSTARFQDCKWCGLTKIGESATQSCTWRAKPHENGALTCSDPGWQGSVSCCAVHSSFSPISLILAGFVRVGGSVKGRVSARGATPQAPLTGLPTRRHLPAVGNGVPEVGWFRGWWWGLLLSGGLRGLAVSGGGCWVG